MRPTALAVFFAASLVFPAAAQPAAMTQEKSFLTQNQQAMATMMRDMAVPPTGDVDRDFVAMMSAHHQGAIDMAILLLRYGKNENLRRMAQEIIVTQQQEIAAMRLAVGEPLPPSTSSPTHMSHAMPMTMPESQR